MAFYGYAVQQRRGKICQTSIRHTKIVIAISTQGASTHEDKLVEETLSKNFTRTRPQRLIGDMAYNSDPLDQVLRKKKIEMIAAL
jgi:hypothetical protein